MFSDHFTQARTPLMSNLMKKSQMLKGKILFPEKAQQLLHP